MAGYECKRKWNPKSQPKALHDPALRVISCADPDSFYALHPSWSFSDCDTDEKCKWAFNKQRLSDTFWDDILPKLSAFESMTWNNILIDGKKQNHSVSPDQLNKAARDRLAELHIEAESIYSLRLGGKLRLYGFMIGQSYHILWYDEDHGDNSTCVYQSKLKHT